MSHRVTTQTEIKDKACAIKALQKAGWAFQESGSRLTVTSGPMRNATLDLTTGQVSGDTDYGHSRGDDSLGALKMYYAEQKYVQECHKQGITILERGVDAKSGEILLRCSAHFG